MSKEKSFCEGFVKRFGDGRIKVISRPTCRADLEHCRHQENSDFAKFNAEHAI